MYPYMPTLKSIRRWVEGLKRRFARELAMVRVLPVAKQIVELWDIAIANQQPKPDPMTCIGKFTDAGIRMQTFKNVHIYLRDCGDLWKLPRRHRNRQQALPPRQKGRRVRRPLLKEPRP